MKALSSKRLKVVWQVIHRIVHPSPRPLRADPDILNNHFVTTTERTLGTVSDDEDLVKLVEAPPRHPGQPFTLRKITSGEVKREIDSLRSDCSTGVDQIPAKYIKLVK